MGKVEGMREEVCSTDDVVMALLDHFVEPFLPRYRTRQDPKPSQHQTMAKQMHAVVLLYNYYHRKRYHEQEFLDFTSFCTLAAVLKPRLLAYMKLMQQAHHSKMDDLEDKLSQTEKAIVNACNVSSALDASKIYPVIDGWPVSKVAIFLVNLRKENCLLLDSSITHGIWSVIEKDLEEPSVDSDDSLESKCHKEQKGVSERDLKDLENNADEARLLDLALLTVEGAAGINKSDLVVLESHRVYSLNKPKAAARLYIMQCTQSINDDICIPIKDTIESLQGPLVKRSSCGWIVTPLVKYFHMLPYMEALSDWSSRELVYLPSTNDQTVANSIEMLITQVNGPLQMDVHGSHADFSRGESESQNCQNAVKVFHRLNKAETGNYGLKPCDAGCNDDMITTTRYCSDPSLVQNSLLGGDIYMADLLSQTQHHEKLQATKTSGNAPSRSALSTLYWERQKLCEQRQSVEAKIMQCDKHIGTLLNGGGDDLPSGNAPMMEDIDAYLNKEEIQQSTEQKSLSESPPSMESQCKKLDELCHEKNWSLPKYQVFPHADGFITNVIVKDGIYTCQGKACQSPHEAREIAAAYILPKIGNLGK